MSKCRIFINPDGSLRIFRPNEKLRDVNESDELFISRVGDDAAAKAPSLVGLTYVDADVASLPADTASINKWRVKNGKVEIDPTIPDPPDPKKALKDRLNAANTVPELKAIIADLIK